MIKQNQKVLNGLFIAFDAITLVISFILSWFIRFKTGLVDLDRAYLGFNKYIIPIMLILPLYLIIYNFFHLYLPHRTKNFFDEIIDIVKSNTFVLFILILTLYMFKEIDYSRWFLVIYWIVNTMIICVERACVRYILRRLRKNNYNIKHIIIIGLSEVTYEFLKRVKRNRHWGYDILGVICDEKEIDKESINYQNYKSMLKYLGDISELKYVLESNRVDEVYITLNLKDYEKLGNIIGTCENVGVRTQIIPSYLRYIPAKPYVEEIEGLPIINIRYVPLDSILNNTIKRSIDVIGSLICLIVFLPIMVIVTISIKLTSPGPIIFKQERVGYNRKVFTMYKFRSMHLQNEDEEKFCWTNEKDKRKTKLGSFIRRTSIDELPQLINVLIGDMSLVGPRPERPFFVDKFKDEIPKYMIKHQVRPGMTGWAQVNGLRGNTSIEERIKYDIYYIENWSLTLDLKIFGLTISKGFVNRNAY